ncbi:hypothetical protein, partial [Pleurocapsa sp. CCALA 161]|uniref:hypothetical protein n=1 Tax=Pleurocapsa sp. CCALA 161 TaxID=2107688 RepID=UPI0011B24A9D
MLASKGNCVTTDFFLNSNHLDYKELDGDWNIFDVDFGKSILTTVPGDEGVINVTGSSIRISYDTSHGYDGTRLFERDPTINFD